MNLNNWQDYYQENEYSLLSQVSKSFELLFEGNINKCCEALFGFHSAMTHKLLLSKILKEDGTINISLANRVYVFSCFLNFNRDLIFKAVQEYSLSVDVNDEQYPTKTLINFLKKKYKEPRLLKIFFHQPMFAQEIEDLSQMIKRYNQKSNEEETLSLFPQKPSSFEELHQILDMSLSNFDTPNISLNQREDILNLDGEKILNNMTIKVPKSHFDLVKLGNQLNFCIGNGSYTEKARQGKRSIISIMKDGIPLYGIEFNRYSIKQAKGFGNSALSKELLNALEQILIKEPILPEDFIKIEGHPFIYGYKYNNTDLFMMLRGGLVYIYHNMDREIYDGLVASEKKGKYFQKYIRPNKNFSKKEII